ncbi:AIPR family protein [Nocardiopsis dassonvillei]|uniref:AIPR family protein n=1 Tax=Nocardiopsis dassonvillei TaxID=2014 RepID=UPI0033F6DF63
MSASLSALRGRSDLLKYGKGNALMLFSLQLKFGIEDIDSVAAVALTDDKNDKKCDMVYIDRDNGIIVLAQSYHSERSRKGAKANKASDLNTAASWLLAGDLSTLPEALKSAAIEVRDALGKDEINELYIWFCHNLPETEVVQRELTSAVNTAASLLRSHFPESSVPSVTAEEIGTGQLEALYQRVKTPIVVTDNYTLEIPGGFETFGDGWKAYCTSVSAGWLHDIWKHHKVKLTSPNVRGYLGIVKSRRNINHGIKTTLKETPERFWIYNNGLTVLVNDYQVREAVGSHTLRISGIGIINGAQTTGSIGTLPELEANNIDSAQVMVRFVQCNSSEIVEQIVKYNNTQNKVEASDFRSKDPVQERLREEFRGIPDSDYRGGRRGGARDAIERSKNLLPDGAVAQSLAAFHGKPNVAYNETRRIWEEDAVYASVFSDKTSARHIVLTYSLQRAIEEIKRDLSQADAENPQQATPTYMNFLKKRGSIPLLVFSIAECMEIITGRVISERRSLIFDENVAPREAIEKWKPIVRSMLPFVHHLENAVDNNLKSPEKVRESSRNFQSMVESIVALESTRYQSFSESLKWT